MIRAVIGLMSVCLMVFGGVTVAQDDRTGDGIPANCESAPPEKRVLFPRYEFQNARLLLVNWNTGADALLLETGLIAEAVYFRDWVDNCRYLVGTVQQNNRSHFVVWDTQTGSRVATVAGLRPNPYAYHVYGNRLIVETPDDARLIALPSGHQVTIPAPWDEFRNRNFDSRPTINADRGWVVVNPVDGLRRAYDLQTGQEVEDYLRQTVSASAPDQLNKCDRPRSYSRWSTGRYTVPATWHQAGYYLMYDDTQVILYNTGQQVRVLKADLQTPELQVIGFSEDCGYVAVAARSEDGDIYDTYVWDTRTGRELLFPDARRMPHPFRYLSENRALIETRNGGYLWKLDTGERVQIVEGVRVGQGWSPDIDTVYQMEVVDKMLLAVTVDDPARVTVFDLNSGAEIAYYDSGLPRRVQFDLIQPGWLLVSTRDNSRQPMGIGLWPLDSGGVYYLRPEIRDASALFIVSENERYFVQAVDDYFQPGSISYWDLQNLRADGRPTDVVEAEFLEDYDWSDRYRLREGILTVGERQYDIFTGEMLYIADDVPALPPSEVTASRRTCAGDVNRRVVGYADEIWMINADTGERLVQLADGSIADGRFSPGECYILVTRAVKGRWNRYYLIDEQMLFDGRTYEPIALPNDEATIRSFSPDGETALVYLASYSRNPHLWHIPTDSLTPLTIDLPHPIYRDEWLHWSLERGQLFMGHLLSVRAFDLQTGQMTAYYEGNSAWDNYQYSSLYRGEAYVINLVDNRWLALGGSMITVIYDLDTGANTAIRTDQPRSPVRISPSGRYVIVPAARMEPSLLHIWDLHNLPETLTDRTPALTLSADEAEPYLNHD